MVTIARRSTRGMLTGVSGCALALSGLATLPVAPATAATDPSISIDDPGAVRAGPMTLTGRVGAGSSETTTVLYVLDATRSTRGTDPIDCDGDGVPATAADDLNEDGRAGETLDCEIGAVRALNADLAASAGGNLQVGLVAFADRAAVADLSPSPDTAVFLPPGFTGGDAVPRVVQAAASVRRVQGPNNGSIGKFEFRDLGGSASGTAFDSAVTTAIDTLAQAPAGPKWVMFLSNGAAPLDAVTRDSLTAAAGNLGVRLRSFAIGGDATCDGNLAKMAELGRDTCVDVDNPASLAASLQGASPANISGVSVTIGDVAFGAELDPVGGWRAGLELGAGTYDATATATLSSGATVKSTRTFTVAAAPPGTSAPPPGTVAAAPGTLLATQVLVQRPAPSRSRHPKHVRGSVGKPGSPPKLTKSLNGATVLLLGRTGPGAPWATVARDTVSAGVFDLTWKRKRSIRSLRVALQAFHGMAASSAPVQVARISNCSKVAGSGTRWTLTCHTTVTKGRQGRLLLGSQVVDRDKVSKGLVKVTGRGKIGRYVLVLDAAHKTHVRLFL